MPASSICVRTVASTRAFSQGFWTKSRAPAPHGFHGEIDRGPGGHHDHGRRAFEREQTVEQVETLLPAGGVAGVVEVDERQGEIFGLHGGERFRRGGGQRDEVALALEQETQGVAHGGLVVGDEDAPRARRGVRVHGGGRTG